MEDINREEFEKLKKAAAEKMREMGNRQQTNPLFPNFVRVPSRLEKSEEEQKETYREEKNKERPRPIKRRGSRADNFLRYMNLPELLKDKDSLLILGLILLLSNEEADETLIMALAYILL